MKIAITSTGKELSSNLDPRFGRAAYFILVDPETMEFEVVDNAVEQFKNGKLEANEAAEVAGHWR